MKFGLLFEEDGLSLDRLRSLVLVDEAGSIAGAAPGERSRQSQYSRQLNELEDFFPVALKRAQGRTIVLTKAGRELAQLARHHLQALEDFQRRSKGIPGEVTLGAGESLHHWLLLPRFARLQKASRNAIWHLRTLQNHTMCRQLADESLDFALLRSDLVTGRLRGEPVGRIGYRLFVPDQLLSRTAPLSLQEALAKLPIALQGDDTLFQRNVEEAAANRGWSLNICLYGESFPQIAQAVAAGSVAGLLPDLAASALNPARTWSIKLDELGEFFREISFAWSPPHLSKRPALEKIREATIKALRFADRDPDKSATR